ncbi:glycosyltransferase [Fodinisporobacter ferrooxydans]|uniref:Glycosyltransferase n=1 Tax=Fodinisporobacter ferrooxydans TaxID=2901836 RepID=A0ABY4CLP6_9BACL|nr:glycosyltransferase [Alicyclobacillaceae bacterium MYW30-H2]
MKENQPVLSICIPTYNRAELLKLSLESLIPQASEFNGEVEIVISDNCSTDHTKDICMEYKDVDYFCYSRNSENIGTTRNIMTLTSSLAKGEYCWVIGDDDLIIDGQLSKIIGRLKLHLEIDYFFVNFFFKSIKERNEIILNKKSKYIPTSEEVMCKDTSEKVLEKWEDTLKIENLYPAELHTHIVSHIFRRKMWNELINTIDVKDDAFSSLDNTFPHIKILATALTGKRIYYFGEPSVLFSYDSQEWTGYLPIIIMDRVQELLELYESLGIDENIINHCKTYFFKRNGENIIKIISNKDLLSKNNQSLKRFLQRNLDNETFIDALIEGIQKYTLNIDESIYSKFTVQFFLSIVNGFLKEKKSIGIWGSGDVGKSLLQFEVIRNNISCIIDTNPRKQGQKFSNTNLVIQPPEYLNENPVDVLIIASFSFASNILYEIRNLYNIKTKVVSIDGVCVN